MACDRILFVCISSSFFLRHHLRWAKAVAGESQRHIAVNIDGSEDAALLEQHGFHVHPLRERRGSVNPFRALGDALFLRRIISRVAPSRIISITLKCLFTTALSLFGRREPPLAGVVTGLGHLFAGNSAKQRLLRGTAMPVLAFALRGRSHCLIHSNADDCAELLRRGVGRSDCVAVVPVPGVDMEEYKYVPPPENGFRIVLPARMLAEKGVEEFAAAAETVKSVAPEVEFILAGGADPGNPSSIPETRLAAWNKSGFVTWLGFVSDMPGLLAGCTVVCLPSHREGFPRVLAEAMAVGRAVVTTDVPGCRDAVVESGAGILVPPRDPQALADALLRMYREPGLRKEMELRGRGWARERLSEESINRRMTDALAMLG